MHCDACNKPRTPIGELIPPTVVLWPLHDSVTMDFLSCVSVRQHDVAADQAQLSWFFENRTDHRRDLCQHAINDIGPPLMFSAPVVIVWVQRESPPLFRCNVAAVSKAGYITVVCHHKIIEVVERFAKVNSHVEVQTHSALLLEHCADV